MCPAKGTEVYTSVGGQRKWGRPRESRYPLPMHELSSQTDHLGNTLHGTCLEMLLLKNSPVARLAFSSRTSCAHTCPHLTKAADVTHVYSTYFVGSPRAQGSRLSTEKKQNTNKLRKYVRDKGLRT